jgi:uncharacterized protein YoaH (UPF0181 family)
MRGRKPTLTHHQQQEAIKRLNAGKISSFAWQFVTPPARRVQQPISRTKAPAIDIRGAMSRVVSTIRIRRDIANVFDFLTTPKNWPEWHPASISVAGSTDHSLTIGEEVTEEFVAAGRRGRTVWRVTAREAPYLWRIESSASEASATITYHLHAEAGTTVFERNMRYRFDRAWLIVLCFSGGAWNANRGKRCSEPSRFWRNCKTHFRRWIA